MKASVVSVNVSEKKGTIKTPVEEIIVLEGFGVKSDAHGGVWHRQVSLLAIESYEKMNDKNISLELGSFAENITTKGVVLYKLEVGSKIQINEVVLEVTQIGKKCHTGCEISQITGDCVMPKEGIFCKVITGGIIKAGDRITL